MKKVSFPKILSFVAVFVILSAAFSIPSYAKDVSWTGDGYKITFVSAYYTDENGRTQLVPDDAITFYNKSSSGTGYEYFTIDIRPDYFTFFETYNLIFFNFAVEKTEEDSGQYANLKFTIGNVPDLINGDEQVGFPIVGSLPGYAAVKQQLFLFDSNEPTNILERFQPESYGGSVKYDVDFSAKETRDYLFQCMVPFYNMNPAETDLYVLNIAVMDVDVTFGYQKPGGGSAVEDYGSAESDIISSTDEAAEASRTEVNDTVLGSLQRYMSGFSAVSAMFADFLQVSVPDFGVLMYFSLAIGMFPLLVGLTINGLKSRDRNNRNNRNSERRRE